MKKKRATGFKQVFSKSVFLENFMLVTWNKDYSTYIGNTALIGKVNKPGSLTH